MDIYVLDNELTRVRTVATSSECLSATEELELGKAGQLTLSLPVSYKDTVKEMNILAIHDRDDRYRLYIVTNRNLNNYTLDIVAISYPNYALSRVGNVEDLRPNNRPLTELIPQILGNSGWTLNHVDENLPGYTGSFYYLSRLECLSQISEALACEFDFYVTIAKNTITGQFVDVVEMLGEDTNRRFEYGTNALEVVAEYDATEVYTQAVGRGKGEETGDGYGRRIEFTDVVWSKANGDPVDKPKGQNWVNDPYENYQLPGNKRPQKIIEFEEITDPNVLLEETYKWLLDNNHPKVQFKAKIIETGALNLGDRVQIIRPDLDIRYKTRVFKLTRNLLNENLTEVEFGDNIATTPMDKLNTITTQVDSTNEAINRVEQQVTMIDANGVRVNYGPNEPTVKKKGDIWYKDNPDGTTSLLRWNGEEWERVIDEGIIADIEKNVEDAMEDAEQAKTDANTARNEASSAINKATQVEQDFNTEISDVKGDIANIDTSLGGMKIDITNANNNATQALATSKGIQTKVEAGGNIWLTPTVTNTKISKYTYISDNDPNINVRTNGKPATQNSEIKYNTPYMKQNKNLQTFYFAGKTDGNRDCFQKSEYNIEISPGDKFNVSFDFYKSAEGAASVGLKLIAEDGSSGWINLASTQAANGNWYHIDGQIQVPNDKVYIKAQPYISFTKVSSAGQYCHMDNISILRAFGTSSGAFSSQITQTAEGLKTEINRQGVQLNTTTQTANTALTNIQNLEQKTDTKFLQTDTLLAMQSQKIGAYYPNGDFSDKTYNKWYTGNGTITSDSTLKVATDGTNKGFAFLSEYIPVEGDKPMYLSFDGAFSSEAIRNSCKVYVHEYDANKTETRNGSDLVFKLGEKPLTWNHIDKTWTFGTSPKYIRIEWVVFNGTGSGDMSIKNITLKNGTESLTGQISVMNDNINLSVKKGDVINQINVSTEGILIDGKKIHITGSTSIDNAVIKDAMIANLSASKLTAGTIDASKINVINLNAANITGINSQFVQSSWNGINSAIKINSSGITSSESTGNFLNLNSNRLKFGFYGSDAYGYVSGGESYGTSDPRQLKIGVVKGSASFETEVSLISYGKTSLTVGKGKLRTGTNIYLGRGNRNDEEANETVDLTNYLNAYATKQILISSGGKTSSGNPGKVRIGVYDRTWANQDENEPGNVHGLEFGEDGDGYYVRSEEAIYNRTYSIASNVYISPYGTIGRSTSARKYKTNIDYIDDIDEAKRTLEIQPAEWSDRKELSREDKPNDNRYIGFIADDFYDAGFDKLITYGSDGEVEEFQYNRLSVYHHQLIKDLYKEIDILKEKINE